MSKRRFGLVLILIFAVAVAAAALVEDFRFDERLARERAAADTLNHTINSAQIALANFRGAQAAYFAAGQGPDFWLKRASDLAAEIEQAITGLQAAAKSPAAATHYEAALSALGGLNGLDQNARDDIASGAVRLAADAIFTDGNAGSQTVSGELYAAQREESAERETRIASLRQSRFRTDAAGIGTLLLLVLIFGMRRRQAPASVISPSVPDAPVVEPVAPVPVVAPEPLSGPTQPDLSEAAELCVDLARVLDGQDIPPLLGRAARVLGARGLVLWVVDGSGALLRPSLAHGYPEKILQRLGPLQVDADNVTSLAFRSMQPQTLTEPGRNASNALAVPLITSSGCIGVLAAEVSGDDKHTLPLARVIAAQLATLVTPAQAGLEQAAEA